MDILKEYLLQNWPLILILIAFVIMLTITVFLNKKTIRRMYVLIGVVFALSISVFFEFYLGDINKLHNLRVVLVAIRYSATPIIISLLLLALVKKSRWYVVIPALVLAIINFISIFTGIVFSIDDNGTLVRGFLGYLPYIGVGIYTVWLIYVLIMQSNKQPTEIIPIIFLALSLGTSLFFPLIIGKEFSKIFCTIVGVALFVYYVFMILQLTKKDALTGLLNRQAYYSYITNNYKDITAIISIDMNGLKKINDTLGHIAGDEAISTVASCLMKSVRYKQPAYRTGGDEFIIVCKKTSEDELLRLISVIRKNVSETEYTVSIGYCHSLDQNKDIDDMVKKSDEMMYKDKERHYAETGEKRR